ncbi:MAG: DoxX family protein [Rikenellaceae bacterium]|nr:DoxX family protein [Rikenellaceae bacterium]MBQ5719617.1 DoxX family protein [Alistipes sp.]
MNNRLTTLLSSLSSDRWFDSAILFMRIFIGAMMLTHGIGKIQNYNAIVNSFPDPLGIGSAVSFTLITLTEVGCSVLIIMGLFTRLATLPLIFGMYVATFIAFPEKTFAEGELSFVYMGIYIMLLISGGGRYALDALFFPYRR